MAKKRRDPGRPPSQRGGGRGGARPGAASPEDVDRCLADLESRGLIRIEHRGGKRGIRPRIGALQLARLLADLEATGSLKVVPGLLTPDMPIEVLEEYPDIDDQITLLVRHAYRYPRGEGAPLGEPPGFFDLKGGVEIRTFLAKDIPKVARDIHRELGETFDAADFDQSLMGLESAGLLKAWRIGDWPATCYQLRYEDGVLAPWPDPRD